MNELINLNNIPKHIAIILDGNGRWAKKRLMPRTFGHRKGAFNIEKVLGYAKDYGVKVVSIYCFSTENWNRPKDEVAYLMKLPVSYFRRYRNKIIESDVKIVFSGREDRCPLNLKNTIDDIREVTKDHKGIVLNICFDYGSQDEIVKATKEIAIMLRDGLIKEEDINKELFESHLDTASLGNVDLMIRTSGEQRLSNFLLYQNAYAEFYFTDCLWPDFNLEEFEKALIAYQKRNRRFGAISEEKKC